MSEKKRAIAGFIISLIAAILILINGIIFGTAFALFMPFQVLPMIGAGALILWVATGVIFGVIVLIGAILIYMPGREVLGGILVLIFSILSIIIGGGFLLGLVLGIIGGALVIAKK